jgi:hypothetical protein
MLVDEGSREAHLLVEQVPNLASIEGGERDDGRRVQLADSLWQAAVAEGMPAIVSAR